MSGPATYDTVLIPYQSKGATVDVERIALDVPTSQTTALKFNSNVDGESATTYYMLDYTNDGAVKTMEQYQTDGQLTVVRINDSGAVKEVILNNGNKVTRTDGTVLVDLGKKVEAFSYEVVGNTIELTTNEENVENMKIYTENAVDAVMVNGTSVAFQQENGQLTLTDEEKPYTPPNDPNANKGGSWQR